VRAIVDEESARVDGVDLDRELDQHVELGDRLPGLERDARDAIAVRIVQRCRRCSGSTSS